jgi:hypothetical protein
MLPTKFQFIWLRGFTHCVNAVLDGMIVRVAVY